MIADSGPLGASCIHKATTGAGADDESALLFPPAAGAPPRVGNAASGDPDCEADAAVPAWVAAARLPLLDAAAEPVGADEVSAWRSVLAAAELDLAPLPRLCPLALSWLMASSR